MIKNPKTWSFINNISEVMLQTVVSVITMRILGPTEFGVIGVIFIFYNFMNLFLDFGIQNAIIFFQNKDDLFYSSLLWLSVLTSIILFGFSFLSANFIASFLGNGELGGYVKLVSVNFLLIGFYLVDKAICEKKIKIQFLTQINLIANIASGIITVYLSYTLKSSVAIIYGFILKSVITLIALQFNKNFKIVLAYSRHNVIEVFHYTKGLIASKFLNFGARNLDNFLIGKYLSLKELGLYSKSYSFLLMPMSIITQSYNRVLIPKLALCKEEDDKIADLIKLNISQVSFLTAPIYFFTLFFSKNIILSFFGNAWIEAVKYFSAFCLLGFFQSITNCYGMLYGIKNKNTLDFKVSILVETIFICSIIAGLKWGITGIIVAIYIATLFNFYFINFIPLKLVSINYKLVMQIYLPYLIAAVLAAGILFLPYYFKMASCLNNSGLNFLYLIINGIIFVTIYLLLINVFNRKDRNISHVKNVLSKFKKNNNGSHY